MLHYGNKRAGFGFSKMSLKTYYREARQLAVWTRSHAREVVLDARDIAAKLEATRKESARLLAELAKRR
jgi:hypothetical protein